MPLLLCECARKTVFNLDNNSQFLAEKIIFSNKPSLWAKLSSKSKISPCFFTYSLGWRCSNKSGPEFFSKQCNQGHGTQCEKSQKIHRSPKSNKAVCYLERFQNLVYNENSDGICVNKTWLTDEVSNKKILHAGYTIYRKDRTTRCSGGVLIANYDGNFYIC